MNCEKCGAFIPDGSKFCPSCGSMTGSAGPTAQQTPTEPAWTDQYGQFSTAPVEQPTDPTGQPPVWQPADPTPPIDPTQPAEPVPPVYSQPPVYGQPPVDTPPPVYNQPPVYGQPPAGMPYGVPGWQFPYVQTPASDLFRQIFSSDRFRLVCILETVAFALSLFTNAFDRQVVSGSLFELVMIIAGWKLYHTAGTGNPNGYIGPLKAVRVMTTIMLVFTWIAAVGLGLLALSWFGFRGIMRELFESSSFGSLIGFMASVALMIELAEMVGFIICYTKLRSCAKMFVNSAASGQVLLYGLRAAECALIALGSISLANAALLLLYFNVSIWGLAASCILPAAHIILALWLRDVRLKTGCR